MGIKKKANRLIHAMIFFNPFTLLQAKTLEDQLQDATEELVTSAVNKYTFTIVAFPDHARHTEIEEIVFQVC